MTCTVKGNEAGLIIINIGLRQKYNYTHLDVKILYYK
jgi:hypothetical protein